MSADMAEVTALRLSQLLSGFPSQAEWNRAQPVAFCHDWRGSNLDSQRLTEVAMLWDDGSLYLRFRCRYRTINVFAEAGANNRRNELWDRDVVEVFLQPDRFGEKYYKEFEVSPNGQWLDLDITPQGLRHITSGVQSNVTCNKDARVWTAELIIPMTALTGSFDPEQPWRVNFFRCEGLDRERFYSSWQPTETQEPNFHIPQKFGWLRFKS